jgi:hypothetical protein
MNLYRKWSPQMNAAYGGLQGGIWGFPFYAISQPNVFPEYTERYLASKDIEDRRNKVMNHPDVIEGQRFMAPWDGPTGAMDHLWGGMPRLYTEDMLRKGLTPKDT